MGTAVLNQRQIFASKRSTLELKTLSFFEDSQDSATLIEYVVAILVKNALVIGDYSLFLNDVIRDLYLSAEPNATMRNCLPFFENYFSKNEWNKIVARLFQSKTNYFQNSKKARASYTQLMQPTTKRELLDEEKERKVNIESTFEDENGKRHKWILRDVDPLKEKQDFRPVLEILTMLSIFESNGTRKFAKLIKSKRVFSEEEELVEEEPKPKKEKSKKAASKKEPRNSAQKPSIQAKKVDELQLRKAAPSADIEPRIMSQEEYQELTRAIVPKGAELKEYYFEYTDPETGEASLIQPDGEKTNFKIEIESEEQQDKNSNLDLSSESNLDLPDSISMPVLSAETAIGENTEKARASEASDSQPTNAQLNNKPENRLKKFLQSLKK